MGRSQAMQPTAGVSIAWRLPSDVLSSVPQVEHPARSAGRETGMGRVRDSRAEERDLRWAQLMRDAQAGDRGAYERLLRDCVPFIRQVATRAGVRGEDRLDDAVQETLLTVHRARHTYDPDRSFSAWLAVLARCRAVDLLRASGRTARREFHAEREYENHPDEAASADLVAGNRDAGRQIATALQTLTPTQRQAVEHLALREQSLAEASAATGRTPGSLKVSLHRALAALRTRMTKDDAP